MLDFVLQPCSHDSILLPTSCEHQAIQVLSSKFDPRLVITQPLYTGVSVWWQVSRHSTLMRHANIRALLWLQVSPQWDTLNKAQLIFCTVGYSPMPGCRDRQKFHFDPSAPAALIQRAIRAINSDDLPRSAVLAAQKITRLSLHSTAKTVSPLFGQGPVS